MIGAAVYARYSSELQQEASIDDQIRNCRRLIRDNGWDFVGEYKDPGISGATTLRPGYQALLDAARQQKFDVVVCEGLDRLSRDQETVAGLYKTLTFHAIKIFTHAEGEINELHVGLKGTMNALFLRDLAIKTHRGLEGRIRKGRSGGGRAYGYNTVKPTDDSEGRGLLEINGAEAAVVRRIFEASRAGHSPRAIARQLNSDGVPGPNGKQWRDTTIRGHATRRTGILRNSLYMGQRVWNKQQYVRDPETQQRVARPNPPDKWIIDSVPHLRIVAQDLWDTVQARLDNIRQSDQSKKIRRTEFWKLRRKKHLFTGLIHCSECGGKMSAIGSDYLACAAARTGSACNNRKSIRRCKVETVVLDGLRHRLMPAHLVEEFISAVHAEINKQHHHVELAYEQAEREHAAVVAKLNGLYDAIAEGLRTPGLQQRLEELEATKAELENRLSEGVVPQPRLHPNLAQLYREKVEDLHLSLSDPEIRTEAAEILHELIERIDVGFDGEAHHVQLTGDIVKLITLPDGQQVHDAFESSVKVVAGARNQLDLQLLVLVCTKLVLQPETLDGRDTTLRNRLNLP